MYTARKLFSGMARMACLVLAMAFAANALATPADDGDASPAAVAKQLAVGDLVFIRVDAKPFREVADATNSWTNHVGIVMEPSGPEPVIAESKFPFSRATTFSKFIARSEHGRFAVARLKTTLSPEQQQRIAESARKRFGIFYDTGFNLHSKRQFCSRFVREVVAEATDIEVGEVETFAHLLQRNPHANVGFWKVWYLGHIPWDRETVTPASLLTSPAVQLVVDHTAALAINTAVGMRQAPATALE